MSTESIGTARLDIVVDTTQMDAGVTKAKRSTTDMAKAAQDASQKWDQGSKRQVAALERQIATLGKSRAEVIRWRIEQQTSGNVAAELTAKLDAQARRMAASATAMDRIGASAKRVALAWAAIATAAGGAALTLGVKNAIDFADKLNDINQRLGISAETLSGWSYAAQQTGTDIEALGTGLRKLARNMTDALDAGSEQGKLFSALGVSVRDANGKLRNMEDVLPEIAKGFRAIENETLKASVAQELFGRSGTDLVEFLSLGAGGLAQMRDRARELGVELSQGTLSAADEFNDRLGDLKTAAQGLFNQLAVSLLPELTKLVEKLSNLAADGERTKRLVDDMTTVFSGAATAIEFAGSQTAVMVNQLAALRTVAEGVIGLDWSKIKQGMGLGLAAQAQSGENLARMLSGKPSSATAAPGLVQEMDITLGAPMTAEERAKLEGRLTGFFAEGKGGKSARTRKMPDFSKEAAAELARLAAEEDNATKAFLRMEAAMRGPLAVAMLEHQERVAELNEMAAKSPIAREGLAEALELEADRYAKVTKEIERQQDPLGLLMEDMRFELDMIGRSNAERVVMNELRRQGIDLMSKEAQAALATARSYEFEAEAKARSIGLMDEFRRGAEDAMVDFVTGAKSAADALKDFFDELGRQITRAIANRWITQAFGQYGQQGGGASGDWIGQVFGAFAGAQSGNWFGFWKNGGAFANGVPVEYFAKGDVFDRATAFSTGRGIGVMGEAGPEAIMPLERGRDGKLGVKVQGDGPRPSGPPQITQNVTIAGRVDQSTLYQIERETGRGVARAMRRG